MAIECLSIPLIEDEAADQQIVLSALKHVEFRHKLVIVSNALESIAYLKRTINSSKYPHIMLVDIAMPKMSGFEMLEELKKIGYGSDIFPKTHILMFTSSESQEDIDKARLLGACGYIVKPTTAKDYQNLIEDTFKMISIK